MALNTRTVGLAAGELKHLVTLERRVFTPAGGTKGAKASEIYIAVATTWASLETIRGGRYVAGKQVEEVATHRFFARFRSDLSDWGFISQGSRRWRVLQSGDPTGERRWIEILAEEMNS